jgi:hypothetical protein
VTYPPPPQDPSQRWQQPADDLPSYPGLPQPPQQHPVQPYPQQPYPVMPPQQRVARQFCVWSIASVVLSGLAILSGLLIPCIGPIGLGIMGAASGHVAENQTRGGAMDGRGLGLVGLVAGWTAPLSSIILLLIVSGSVTGG